MIWHKVSEELPTKEGKYLTCNSKRNYMSIHGFTTDAYKFDKYDFEEYKGKNKSLFFSYDSEYGYGDVTEYVDYWCELPNPPQE